MVGCPIYFLTHTLVKVLLFKVLLTATNNCCNGNLQGISNYS